MSGRHFKITSNGAGHGVIELDGEPLKGVTLVEFRSQPQHVDRVTLDVSIFHGSEVESEDVVICLPESTITTLVALGWTPPPGTLEALEDGRSRVDLPLR